MLMTAAGTIAPAKVLVLGAGVAGLQAIATARRLGAVVEAFDVRKAVKEQVESLGAKFVEVEGGRGRADRRRLRQGGLRGVQAEAGRGRSREHIAKSDVVHHHRAHSRQARADARHRRDGARHEARARSSSISPPSRAATASSAKPGRDRRRRTASPSSAPPTCQSKVGGPREPDVLAQHGEAAPPHLARTARSRSTSHDEITKGCVITPRGRDRQRQRQRARLGQRSRVMHARTASSASTSSCSPGFVGYQVISQGAAPAAHAAHGGTNAISRHLAGRLAGRRRRRLRQGEHRPRLRRGHLRHHQHGRRLPDHRPHAADVPRRPRAQGGEH